VVLELVGGLVAEELHAAAALDDGQALGDEAFQFDRADFRAVRFLLAALLGDLVVVKLAVRPIGSAVKDVDGRPEEIPQVGFEVRVAERRDQRI
jgi:hypothetical protein